MHVSLLMTLQQELCNNRYAKLHCCIGAAELYKRHSQGEHRLLET